MNVSAGHTSESIMASTRYLVALVFVVKFEHFTVRLTSLPNNELNFHVADGPYAKNETVKIATTLIRPGVFIVSLVDKRGATVVHVEDFALGAVYSYATLPDGTFLQMKAAIHLVSEEFF